jgi:hypothetical protein
VASGVARELLSKIQRFSNKSFIGIRSFSFGKIDLDSMPKIHGQRLYRHKAVFFRKMQLDGMFDGAHFPA